MIKNKNKLLSGDIFEVQLPDLKVYFQFVFKDLEYMSSDMIRIFEYQIKITEILNPVSLIKSKIFLYSYTRVNQGINEGYWSKVENIQIEKKIERPTFRQLDILQSSDTNKVWYIWKESFKDRKYVTQLSETQKKLPESIVYAPINLIKVLEIKFRNTDTDFHSDY